MKQRYTVEGMVQLADWTAGTRRILLDFAATLPPEDYTREIDGLGWGSIRNTLVHMASAQDFWFGRVLGANPESVRWDPEDYPDVATLRAAWDAMLDGTLAFLRSKGDGWLNEVQEWKLHWQEEPARFAPAWAVTHAFTHEFHHKGQVVFAARLLGHPPPETDM